MTAESQFVLKSLEDNNITINIVQIENNIFDDGYEVLHISKAMYYRLMVPQLIPQYKKIIYLDCDLIVKKSLSELYDIDLKDNWVAGGNDYPGLELRKYIEDVLELDSSMYINSGVLLINSDKFLENNVAEKCAELLQRRKDFLYPDQDAINTVCRGHIYNLDNAWNMQGFKKEAQLLSEYVKLYDSAYDDPAIIHYSTHLKPWKWLNVHYASEWYKYTALKYYTEKEYFRRSFSKIPALNCNLIKRTLKKMKIYFWQRG